MMVPGFSLLSKTDGGESRAFRDAAVRFDFEAKGRGREGKESYRYSAKLCVCKERTEKRVGRSYSIKESDWR